MGRLKILQIYTSPWSERALWALDFKQLPYDKEDYQIIAGEEALKTQTGQDQLPVLFADDEVIPDSTAILEWLEQHHPEPPLMPAEPGPRAEVIRWEQLATQGLGPQGRLLSLGKSLRSGIDGFVQVAQYLGAKYRHSAFAEERAAALLRSLLEALAQSLNDRQYLVGDSFTRADLTVASMLGSINPPDDAIYPIPEPIRPLLTATKVLSPVVASVFAWRDRMYQQHRSKS